MRPQVVIDDSLNLMGSLDPDIDARTVSLSRVYLSDLSHHCLGGALVGLLVASYVSIRLLFARLDSFHLCQATV